MKKIIKVAPPNSQFYLEGGIGRKFPNIDDIDDRPVWIWSTRSCILVGCLCFVDGETELMISNSADDALRTSPTFDGVLDTPNRIFQVSTSESEILFRTDVPGHFTRVRIWTDHPREPEHILAVLG